MRCPILIGVLCHFSAAAGADSLCVDVSVRAAGGGVWLGEIAADGQPLLRLRGTDEGSLRQRAGEVAQRLRQLALDGIRAGDIAAEAHPAGASVTIRGKPLVNIDSLLAELSGMSAWELATAWERRLREAFSNTYLMLEPAKLLVPYGEARTIAIGGTAVGRFSCSLYAEDIVQVAPTQDGAGVAVRGVGVGSTAVSVERGGHSGVVTIDVRKWAAAIAESARAVVTGGSKTNPALRSAVMNAVLAVVRPEPNAVVRVGLPVPVERHDAFAVSVEATGDGYIPARRETQVRIVNTPAPGLATTGLLVSNDPELIAAPGLLMVGKLPPSQAVRLLYHHKNAMSHPCQLVVALDNVSEQPAQVHVTDAAAGPHRDELFVGHAATRRFTERLRSEHGCVLQIPAGRRADIRTHMLGPGEVASGLARLSSLNAADVRITVTAGGGSDGTGYFPFVPAEVRRAPAGSDCVFQPEKRITASYTVGRAWLFVDIGREAVADRRGSRLQGNYGVWYQIKVDVQNPGDESARIDIAVRAGGGPAWGVFSIDEQVLETPLLSPGQERVLKVLTLGARASRTVAIRTMPEAASSYPVTLIVRSR